VISYYDASGELTGTPISFENVIAKTSSGGFTVATDDLDAASRNFTWNVELDREVRRKLQIRINYLQSATGDLPVVIPMPDVSGSFWWTFTSGFSLLREFPISRLEA